MLQTSILALTFLYRKHTCLTCLSECATLLHRKPSSHFLLSFHFVIFEFSLELISFKYWYVFNPVDFSQGFVLILFVFGHHFYQIDARLIGWWGITATARRAHRLIVLPLWMKRLMFTLKAWWIIRCVFTRYNVWLNKWRLNIAILLIQELNFCLFTFDGHLFILYKVNILE